MVAWILEYLGRDDVHVMGAFFEQWKLEGREVLYRPVEGKAASFSWHENPAIRVTLDEVVSFVVRNSQISAATTNSPASAIPTVVPATSPALSISFGAIWQIHPPICSDHQTSWIGSPRLPDCARIDRSSPIAVVDRAPPWGTLRSSIWVMKSDYSTVHGRNGPVRNSQRRPSEDSAIGSRQPWRLIAPILPLTTSESGRRIGLMARITVEDCLEHITNRFELVLGGARRANNCSKERVRSSNPITRKSLPRCARSPQVK